METMGSYIRKIAAQFIDPFPGLVPDKKIDDRELARTIRQALAAEEEAVHFYEAVVDATDNELAKKVFESIANEEKVHVGEFQALLNRMLPEEQGLLDDGEKEVNEMTREADLMSVLKQQWNANKMNVQAFIERTQDTISRWLKERLYHQPQIASVLSRITSNKVVLNPEGMLVAR